MRTTFERIWENGGLGAWVLSPLAGLYGVGWMAYVGMYSKGLKKAYRPSVPVVCVGNLVAGGSGKSPITLAVADLLQEVGRDVVVSTSGYGSPAQHAAKLAPEGELNVEKWGDESTMMRWLRPDLKLVVGRDRVQAAKVVEKEFPAAVMLMDDGFQHLPVAKNASLVVDLEGANRFCFPAGPYREPRGFGLKRADMVLRNGEQFEGAITQFVDRSGEVREHAGEIDVLCAIANPKRFFQSLNGAGMVAIKTKVLTDHDPLSDPALLEEMGEKRPLVVTAKDFVKLRARQGLGGKDVLVADYKVQLNEREALCDWLLNKIDESVS